jgi:hypothetical protein
MDLIITLGWNVVNDINEANDILIKDKNILGNNIKLDKDSKYKYFNIKMVIIEKRKIIFICYLLI